MRVSWDHWARAERAKIFAADRWRTIRELDSGGPVARLDGCEVVSFASNDYFGLSQHPAVRAAGRGPLVDLIINRARSFIFTTAPAPATTAAALAALRVLRSGTGDALRARLAALTSRVRPGHPSPIIPVVLGDEQISRLLTELAAVVPA